MGTTPSKILLEKATLPHLEPTTTDFLRDVTLGLASSPKTLPCKYFYDQRGSQLFDRICELEEYYVTRTELTIMQANIDAIVDCLPNESVLLELGSGSSTKTRLLLDHAKQLTGYVPVDISHEHLRDTAEALAQDYAHLAILPVSADFTEPFDLPETLGDDTPITVYFPGSTIGNFEPTRAGALLANIAEIVHHGGLLIGIDLKKDVDVLESAYDDSEGVTAAFNLNLLRRINHELSGDFNIEQFQHRAVFNADRGRVEMHLVSLTEQSVDIDGQTFAFAEGETIHTENSHKYTVDEFAKMASASGWQLDRVWNDAREYFAVLHFCL